MAAYRTEDIRNIALVGHAGSGKTSLIEALLYDAGVVGAPGSVEKGDTVTDFDPLEQKHHHSLGTAVVSVDYHGRHINIIDTPGDPEFAGQALAALPAVETAAIVINAQAGIETMTRRMMEQVAALHMPCMIIVNRIDADDPAHLAALMHEIRATFGKECLALTLPARGGTEVVEVLGHDDGETDFMSVREAHTALIDQVVEVDEALMERYLEEGDVDPGQIHDPFEKALREGHLIPVCFVSARTGAGVHELLEIMASLAPNPFEGAPHEFLREEGGGERPVAADPDPDKPVLAHVFKVEYDPFVGKMGLIRIHRGTIRKGMQLLIDEGERSFKVGHLYRVQGKEHLEIDEAVAGDICAVAKVEDLHYDAVVHATHEEDHLHPRVPRYPTPLVGLALKPQSRGDEQKVSDVLHKLVAEDPCLRIEHDVAANETVLRGLGELHLRVALEKMDERFHVHVETHPPSIPYRETITRRAKGHHRHKKQTGGAGQFGEVFLEVEPLARGAGFEFVDRVTGGVIPSQFIPAVEKGVRQVLDTGAIAGFPLQDVRVIVYDGKHHSVDSKEIAFIVAGRKAFMDAVTQAGPIVLEPLVNLEVTVPSHAMGDITGDLASRRGRIHGSETRGDNVVISAEVPLAELNDYASRLKSLTGGEGSYSMEFSRYEAAPGNVQKELVARHHASA